MFIAENEGPAFWGEIARLSNAGDRLVILETDGDMVPDGASGLFYHRLVTEMEAVSLRLAASFDLVIELSAGEMSFANKRSEELARGALQKPPPAARQPDEYSAMAAEILGGKVNGMYVPDAPAEKVALATKLLRTANCRRGLLVKDAENLFPAQEADKQLLSNLAVWRDLAAKEDVVIIVATTDRSLLHPFLNAKGIPCVKKGVPTKADYKLVLQTGRILHPTAFNGYPLDELVDAALNRGVACRTMERLILKCESQGTALSPELLKRHGSARVTASKFLVAEIPKISLDDIAGLDDVKEQLRRGLIDPLARPDDARKLGTRRGLRFLLFGPPGTGKTLFVSGTANLLNAPLFTASAADIMGMYVGSSEQNVQQLFAAARAAAARSGIAMIFIDEAEGLLRDRDSSDHEVSARVVSQLLTELQGLDTDSANIVFAVATNKPWELDTALRRGRIDVRIYVPLPDHKARREIWRLNLKARAHGSIDYDLLAERSDGFSGADIAGLCGDAAKQVLAEVIKHGRKVSIEMADVTAVLKEAKPSVSRETIENYEKYVNMHHA